MFTWLGLKLDAILSTYVLNVVSSLMAGLAPVALACMTVWVTFYGWAVLRGEVSESVPAFVWKTCKISVVLTFALQSSLYISDVAETANALSMGVATTLYPDGADPKAIATPYALLDKMNDEASEQVADIMKEAGISRLDLLLAAAIFSIGSVAFLCIALFVVTLSKLLLTFVLGVGPLFILCLAWRPTARFFDSWLSMLLNTAVLAWFAFFALGISHYMGESMLEGIKIGGGFLGENFNVLGEATRYCVLMILMAIICFQAPTLASALTGGAAVQHGMQMIQNALLITNMRSATGARSSGTASGGGTVHRGVGLPYMVGRMSAAAAVSLITPARRGHGSARTAAYQLAARRGRAS